ncbi:MAG: DUF5615 family PIN-like protein [Bryobacteraceae bacterium]
MKFKLDENLPIDLVTDLRALGHDADTVVDEGLGGAAHPSVGLRADWLGNGRHSAQARRPEAARRSLLWESCAGGRLAGTHPAESSRNSG